MKSLSRIAALVWLLCCASHTGAQPPAGDADAAAAIVAQFEREVDRRLEVPAAAQADYLQLLAAALKEAGLAELGAQHIVLVDRSPQVQALFVVLRTPEARWRWIGATPVSTGRAGGFEHFLTPLGVFAHSLDNPDFRAEGTFNANLVRGYGARGMRVFDFGWVVADRTWGRRGRSPMRLQMHATDPVRLEPRLGRAESKGCIRIPATLNVYIDRHGLLDADYEQALARGEPIWVLRADRRPTPWPGRYLVIVDSGTTTRPSWSMLQAPARASVKDARAPVC
jgi:hypothetical protein